MASASRPARAVRPRTIRRLQAREAKSSPSAVTKHKRSVLLLGAVLILGTLALYSPVRTHDFINYDDKDYVLDNPHITAGLKWTTIRWSLTATEQANWHPITWL